MNKKFTSSKMSAMLPAFLLLIVAVRSSAQTRTFDLVISNGHIIDGTGSPWYSGDLGIRDGHIAAIGNLSAAARKRTIDAAGKVVAPGFIDMLGQSELTILVDPRLPSKIYQGITSEVTGEGGSIAPLNDAIIQSDRDTFDHYKIKSIAVRLDDGIVEGCDRSAFTGDFRGDALINFGRETRVDEDRQLGLP